MILPTTERLALSLEHAHAPKVMITAARAGAYDDCKSESATPITDLVRDLTQAARDAPGQPLKGDMLRLAQRAKLGEFDATREESEAWAAVEARLATRGWRQSVPKRKQLEDAK